MLKYKCLVLDHDDTVVQTTKDIHFPSFKRTINELKPNLNITEKEFLINCFDPGFFEYMDNLGFTKDEMEYQLKSWLDYVENVIPVAYDGIKDIIIKQKNEGGLVAVISHSYSEIIKRDYIANFGIMPDMIYGGEEPPEKRKPSIYPLEDLCNKFNLNKKDLIFIDDLKPGMQMAKNFGVDFICAGWSHTISEISDYMKDNCKVYANTVSDVLPFIFK